MKYIAIILVALFVSMGYSEAERHKTEASLALQQDKIETLQAKSEKCAKKASNFSYIIDKKLYSEESALKIYSRCLEE